MFIHLAKSLLFYLITFFVGIYYRIFTDVVYLKVALNYISLSSDEENTSGDTIAFKFLLSFPVDVDPILLRNLLVFLLSPLLVVIIRLMRIWIYKPGVKSTCLGLTSFFMGYFMVDGPVLSPSMTLSALFILGLSSMVAWEYYRHQAR